MTSQEIKFIDYSHEVKMIRSPIIRYLLIGLSFIFLAIGVIGIFLPVLPTTPFILLSAFLYARSSTRFYNWIMNHKIMGPPLRQWKTDRSIPKKAKILAITMIAITIIPSALFIIPILAVKILLIAIGLAVSIYIGTRPNA